MADISVIGLELARVLECAPCLFPALIDIDAAYQIPCLIIKKYYTQDIERQDGQRMTAANKPVVLSIMGINDES